MVGNFAHHFLSSVCYNKYGVFCHLEGCEIPRGPAMRTTRELFTNIRHMSSPKELEKEDFDEIDFPAYLKAVMNERGVTYCPATANLQWLQSLLLWQKSERMHSQTLQRSLSLRFRRTKRVHIKSCWIKWDIRKPSNNKYCTKSRREFVPSSICLDYGSVLYSF